MKRFALTHKKRLADPAHPARTSSGVGRPAPCGPQVVRPSSFLCVGLLSTGGLRSLRRFGF
ncbi:hypothetical protein ACS5NO_13870 [Larkinella sp. GY13]|uniref:hypothetical protein n=1 Tax=Larkinella sp. GY13 TaxID=3453720 RepID=UPI003EEB379F